jgi:hypothetical protein
VVLRFRSIRSLAWGAGSVISVALVVASCSSTAQRTIATTESTAPPSVVAETSVPVVSAVETTVAGAVAPESTIVVDGAATLAQAVSGLGAGYHFTTTVYVNGAETLVADGDRIADSTRLSLFSKGGSVAYVITPAGSWAFPEGGEWSVLDSPPATADPIIALQTPLAVTVVSTDGTTTAMTVTVAAAALGIAADGNADVQVTVSGGVLQSVSYSAALTDGTTADVTAVIGPLTDTTPIVPPI